MADARVASRDYPEGCDSARRGAIASCATARSRPLFPAWFKKASGTVAGTAGHRPKVGRVLRTTVPDPFLNHAYMFRYQPEESSGLSRDQFVWALRAEGIPCFTGCHPLNKAGFIRAALNSRPYVNVYGKEAVESWAQRNQCPEDDKLREEAVWFNQRMSLGPQSDMEKIVQAVRKVQAHAPALVRA